MRAPTSPIHQQSEQLRSADCLPRDLVQSAIENVQKRDAVLHSCTQLFVEEALQSAETLKGNPQQSPLWGLPWLAKENIATRRGRTTCGSRMLRDYCSPVDATVVSRLETAGAVLIGKTNCDEFAMGSTTEFSAWGPTTNPYDPSRVAGGSSGGSAAAVAAGFVSFALGSDTGGSVRQPAAWCGVVGLKPTYGRLSRSGLVAFANSLDHIGVLATSVADAGTVLQAIAGHDRADATSLHDELREAANSEPRGSLRLGIPWEWIDRVLAVTSRQEFARVTEVLRQAGAMLVPVSLAHASYASRCYHVIAAAEATTQLARYDGIHYGWRQPQASMMQTVRRSRSTGFGAEVKRRILLGTYVLTEGYRRGWLQRAQEVRRRLRQEVDALWETCDALLLPTTPTPACRLGALSGDARKRVETDVFTTLANLTGVPAIALPSGFVHGLPVGVQVHAPRNEDLRALRMAAWVEQQLSFPTHDKQVL